MEEQSIATLTVEKGSEQGKVVRLSEGTVLIGRSQEAKNAIALNDPFISRHHAEISYSGGCFFIRDLNSKNGTMVNGETVEAMTDCRLGDNDIIDLAGVITIRFRQTEGTQAVAKEQIIDPAGQSIAVDEQTRDAWVDGQRLEPTLTRKEFELLSLLYRNMNKACSKEDIASHVWQNDFVTDEQIEQYIYRIRKRVEADPSKPERIITLRGYGYKLVSEEKQ